MAYQSGQLNEGQIEVIGRKVEEAKELVSKLRERRSRLKSAKTLEDVNWLIKETLQSVDERLKEREEFIQLMGEEVELSKRRLEKRC